MKKVVVWSMLVLALGSVACEEASQPESTSCYSASAPLVGKWVMVAQRSYGGCCPPITDTAWKPADATASVWVSFTGNGLVRSNTGGQSGTDEVETSYAFKDNVITLDKNILSGASWVKEIPVVTLSEQELVLTTVIGKEGEKNDRRYRRSCN